MLRTSRRRYSQQAPSVTEVRSNYLTLPRADHDRECPRPGASAASSAAANRSISLALRISTSVASSAVTASHPAPSAIAPRWSGLMSHRGLSIEEIARLAGHASTRTTEIVYRRELRPGITTGAEIMDELFGGT